MDQVENERGEGTSIHWHGQYQHGSQWADGVPGVTQCPIAPGSLFPFYQFTANPAGTFWYHSHTEFQRDDGLSGVFVVRDSDDVACDLTEHVVHLQVVMVVMVVVVVVVVSCIKSESSSMFILSYTVNT